MSHQLLHSGPVVSLRLPIRASSHYYNFQATLFCTSETAGHFLLNILHVIVEIFRAAYNSFCLIQAETMCGEDGKALYQI